MLLTVREAAKALGVHADTARRWIKAGALPSVHAGRLFVRSSDLAAYTGDPEERILRLAGKGESA